MLGRAEGGRAGFHVDVRGERPVGHRRTGPDELGERDGGECFGVGKRDRAGHRDRGHGAHQRERGDNRHLPGAGEVDQALQHRHIERARRVGVDDRVAVRIGRELGIAQPAKVADHLESVLHLRRAACVDEGDFVGMAKLSFEREIVPDMGGDVLGFDQRGDHVEHVEMLGQLDQIAEVFVRAGTAALDAIRGVRTACAGLEGERTKLQRQFAVASAAHDRDGLGRGGERGPDHVAADADHLGVFVDDGPAFAENLARFGEQDLDGEVFEDGERGLVHGLDFVVGKDVHRWERVLELTVVYLAFYRRLPARRALAPPPPTCLKVDHPRIA